MVYLHSIILAFVSFLFQIKANKAYTLRTDGFYLYDNGIDTFQIMPDSKDLYLAGMAALRQKNLCLPGKSRCQPDSVVVLKEGSPFIHYIAFFDNFSGTALVKNCRDKSTRDEAMATIAARKNKTGKHDCFEQSEQIHAISFLNDSTFTFLVQDDSFFHEKYRATIQKNGLSITDISNRMMKTPEVPCNYIFMPNN